MPVKKQLRVFGGSITGATQSMSWNFAAADQRNFFVRFTSHTAKVATTYMVTDGSNHNRNMARPQQSPQSETDEQHWLRMWHCHDGLCTANLSQEKEDHRTYPPSPTPLQRTTRSVLERTCIRTCSTVLAASIRNNRKADAWLPTEKRLIVRKEDRGTNANRQVQRVLSREPK